jgi:hypothetical protein
LEGLNTMPLTALGSSVLNRGLRSFYSETFRVSQLTISSVVELGKPLMVSLPEITICTILYSLEMYVLAFDMRVRLTSLTGSRLFCYVVCTW